MKEWSAKKKKYLSLIFFVVTLIGLYFLFFVLKVHHSGEEKIGQDQWHPDHFHQFIVDPKADKIRFVWKDAEGDRFGSIGAWKKQLEKDGRQLVFATNGGMYEADGSPVGLFIEQGETRSEIDLLENGYGNFYLQPNGVFFITSDNKAGICETSKFSSNKDINYATQSGPMLLIDEEINDQFRSGSNNKHIRNGVGLLEDGRLLFAMSKTKVSFHDFAYFFKQSGCKNALYLDGFVSRMYAPGSEDSGIEQLDGDFGVIIGVVK